jgi:hypothetical protein
MAGKEVKSAMVKDQKHLTKMSDFGEPYATGG